MINHIDELLPQVKFGASIIDHSFDYLLPKQAHYYVYGLGLKFIDTYFTPSTHTNIWTEVQKSELGWDLLLQDKRGEVNVGHLIKSSETSIVLANYNNSTGSTAKVFATTEEEALTIKTVLSKIVPRDTYADPASKVPFRFWSYSPDGAVMRKRDVQPLIWNNVTRNYPAEVLANTNQLFQFHPPATRGRLILWHGPPGTGKSSAIRALSLSWLPWCNSSYIIDPEKFFGSADYMLDVLLDTRGSDFYYDPDFDSIFGENADLVNDGKDRWNLLIVEDADEFLVKDAKERTGQSLSRLLNLGDGLIGQGLNFLILITTNEPLPNIHEAVSRPGRCMANIEFRSFTPNEAKAWLGDTKIPNNKVRDTYPLSTLYDILSEDGQINMKHESFSHGTYL